MAVVFARLLVRSVSPPPLTPPVSPPLKGAGCALSQSDPHPGRPPKDPTRIPASLLPVRPGVCGAGSAGRRRRAARAPEGYRVHERLASRAAPPAGPPARPPARPPAPRRPAAAAAAATATGGAVFFPGARLAPGAAAELGGRHGVQHGPGDDPGGFSGGVSGPVPLPPPVSWCSRCPEGGLFLTVCVSTAAVWGFLGFVGV